MTIVALGDHFCRVRACEAEYHRQQADSEKKFCDILDSKHTNITKAMTDFRFGKGSFNCLFSPIIDYTTKRWERQQAGARFLRCGGGFGTADRALRTRPFSHEKTGSRGAGRLGSDQNSLRLRITAAVRPPALRSTTARSRGSGVLSPVEGTSL